VVPPDPPRLSTARPDPLKQQIEDLWAERDTLMAEFGDPAEAIDQFAEEFFGSDEATAVLLAGCRPFTEERRHAVLGRNDKELIMSVPRSPGTRTPAEDRLQRQIDEHWAEHDRLISEYGDPDEAVDRLSEELFGSDEETGALLDYLRRTIHGPDPEAEDDEDDGW
jgi:hypothetical protein